MALPTLTSRIAFGSAPFAASPSWDDISSDLLSLNIKKGRQHALDRMEAGTCFIELKNDSEEYWPDNSGGSYYPNVVPVRRINLRATYGGSTYDLFTGYVRRYRPRWRARGGFGSVMVVRAADVLRNLARLEINDGTGFSSELSGTRIDNVLDLLSSNIGRDLDTGQSTLIASGAITNVKALAHLHTVQWSEAGYLFVAGDGDVQFHDRHARLKSPYTTSQATFGDDAGEMPYADIEFDDDDEYILNDIRRTRSGGTEQTASDATSQTNFGKRSHSRQDLLMTTDAEALSQAQYHLKQYKDAVMRLKSITILPDRDPANLYPKVLLYDIGTRITVRLNQASVDKDYHIEGIEHTVDARTRRWSTKWQLSDADSQIYWAIGVAGFGEIGETTYAAY